MPNPSYRLVRVGRSMSGMLGLDEIFADLYEAGKSPSDTATQEELVRRARKENYIPAHAEVEFAEALLREYRSYCQTQADQTDPSRKRRRVWRGFPREQIAWYPSIFEDLCNNCGKCVEFCPEKVFAWENDRVIVHAPFDCQVGCNSCERICPCKAISFPPQSILRGILGPM